jgi:hypothetical protein
MYWPPSNLAILTRHNLAADRLIHIDPPDEF